MKKTLLLAATLGLLSALAAPLSFREPAPVPGVSKLSYEAGTEVRLDAAQTVTVKCPDASSAAWARTHLEAWFLVEPKVVAETAADKSLSGEAYRLVAKPDGISVEAQTLAGVRYAFYTLRQVAERMSVGETVVGFHLPALEIEDKPALGFRGLHLCWFPELSADYIERQIRMAAFYKFNFVVIEPWGVYRSERHPWFGWKDGLMTKDVIRHLVDVASDLGVTLVPQINVWGHATASRGSTGKHAALDASSAHQSLFEPGAGWNWCLSNPDALRVIRELVVEMHEAFGNPPYFHIGGDEAEGPSCANCRAVPYSGLVRDHIVAISELLKKRGARTLMWHDMMLKRGDPRWKDFYANGTDETAKLPDLLPKDIVVCDWYYGKGRETYPTLDYFGGSFATLTCTWDDVSGIRAQAKYVREHALFGVLGTVWHHMSGDRFVNLVQFTACGAWGGDEKGVSRGGFAQTWRQCGWDMGVTGDYADFGWYVDQISRDIQGL